MPENVHTCLSFAISTPCIQLAMADFSWFGYFNILSPQNTTLPSSSQLHGMSSQSPHWVLTLPNIDACNSAEIKSQRKKLWSIHFASFLFPDQYDTGYSTPHPQIWLLGCAGCYQPCTRVAAGSVWSCFLRLKIKLPIPWINWRLRWMESYLYGTFLGFKCQEGPSLQRC